MVLGIIGVKAHCFAEDILVHRSREAESGYILSFLSQFMRPQSIQLLLMFFSIVDLLTGYRCLSERVWRTDSLLCNYTIIRLTGVAQYEKQR